MLSDPSVIKNKWCVCNIDSVESMNSFSVVTIVYINWNEINMFMKYSEIIDDILKTIITRSRRLYVSRWNRLLLLKIDNDVKKNVLILIFPVILRFRTSTMYLINRLTWMSVVMEKKKTFLKFNIFQNIVN